MEDAQGLIAVVIDEYNKEYGRELNYENSAFILMISTKWNTIYVNNEVKLPNKQKFTLFEEVYGLVNSWKQRVYVSKSWIKNKINYDGQIVHTNTYQKLYTI